MAKPLIRLKILVSCTSELQAERRLIDQVVEDANRVTEDTFGVTLRAIDWRRDIVPGAGTDAQGVINSQTTDYEVYIGMLGTRFGTPTPRAGSGTEDEFNLAYQRFRRDPKSVRLLFYFRTGVVGGAFDIDVDQLKRVQEFRGRLGREKGILFCDFTAAEEFIQLLRGHLIELVRSQWEGERWKPVMGLEESASDVENLMTGPKPESQEEELGPLDMRARLDEAFEGAMAAVRGVSTLMATSAEADRAWTQKAQATAASKPRAREAQLLIDGKAADFKRRGRDLRSLRVEFRVLSEEFFDSLSQWLEYQLRVGDSTREGVQSAIRRVLAADNAVRAARDTYSGVAATLAALPDLTREFRIQKRQLVREFELFTADVGAWLDRSAELRKQFGVDDSDGQVTPDA